MNRDRRKNIKEACCYIDMARSILEKAGEEERDGFDNLPESFQDSDRGMTMEDNCDAIDDAVSMLDEAKMGLGDI